MPAVSGSINPVAGFAASAVTGASTTTATLNFGTTAPKNSLILVGATGNGGTGAWTGPSGYTAVPYSANYATNARQTLVWAKIATGSETSATVTGTATTTGIALACVALTGFQFNPSGLSATLSRNYGGATGTGTSITLTTASGRQWDTVNTAPFLAVTFCGSSTGLAAAYVNASTGWDNPVTTAATGLSAVGSAAIAAGYANCAYPYGDTAWVFGGTRTVGIVSVGIYPQSGGLTLVGMGA